MILKQMTIENTVKKYRALFASKPAVTTAHTDKGHFYVSPATQEKYHSVTYFTSFIKDPSLANWKMNRALDFIWDHQYEWTKLITEGDKPTAVFKLWEQAKLAPEREFKGAGDTGTSTHQWRQQWFQEWIASGVCSNDLDIDLYPLPANADPEVISGCRAIKRFLKETGAIPVACELPLVDDELKVGGTIDDLMVFPNLQKKMLYNTAEEFTTEDFKYAYKSFYKPFLGFVDLKTSNQGKKPAYAYQVRGFYQRMIWKTFMVHPKKTIILHTSKDDGTYKPIDLTDMKFLEKDACDLVRLSRSWDKIGEAFKPKQIVI